MSKMHLNYPLLVTDYISEESLKIKCDGLIINSRLFSTFNDETYSVYKLQALIKKIKDAKKKIIVNVNRIIPENEIDDFKEVLLMLIDSVDYLIYSDLSVLNIIPENKYDKLIYDSKTLICSKEELSAFPTDAFISQALSFDEIKDFQNGEKKICLDAFGYLEMMYSRRPLLSLVVPRGKVKTNTLYTLKEETRTESYKIFEVKRQKNNYGTFVYNDGIYVLFKEINELFDNVKIIRLNSMFLTNIIDKVATVYNKYISEIYKGTIDNYKEDYYYTKINSILENSHLKLTRGFLDQESVLLKEEEDG